MSYLMEVAITEHFHLFTVHHNLKYNTKQIQEQKVLEALLPSSYFIQGDRIPAGPWACRTSNGAHGGLCEAGGVLFPEPGLNLNLKKFCRRVMEVEVPTKPLAPSVSQDRSVPSH